MSTPGGFPRHEVEQAWRELCRLGAEEERWEEWADLFTRDATFQERRLGTHTGRAAVKEWIVEVMAELPAMSLWVQWAIIDGDRIACYLWHNLPDPTGTGERFGFPSTTILHYAGHGKFDWGAGFSNPAHGEQVVAAWVEAGGNRLMPKDRTLRGIPGWAPEPRGPAHRRAEVQAAFEAYRQRAAEAVATGDWTRWSALFTEDAHYREHHYGYFRSRGEIDRWIGEVMQPFPSMEFPPAFVLIDGNQVNALIPNILPAPDGDDGYYGFDVHTILHYAGDGRWSYEEDVYSPAEAQAVVGRWLAAGGVIPG